MKQLLSIFLLALSLSLAAEEVKVHPIATTPAWYVGFQGGVPFGVSTFSAFGHDQVHGGFVGGIYGGYRFHPVVSLEAFAKWGTMALTAQACCVNNHLWLGTDGIRYNAPVLNMEGWNYSDLHSQVFMQQYGLQVNINLLGCFSATRDSRWTLEVSPLLAAVITKAEVTNQADGAAVRNSLPAYGVGAGGNVQVGFQASKHINVGIYSGITYLTGKSFDGMPDCPHSANYVWESGVRLAFVMPTGAATERRTAPLQNIEPQVEPAAERIQDTTGTTEATGTTEPERRGSALVSTSDTTVVDTTIVASPAVSAANDSVSSSEAVHKSMHSIFFTFNSTRIRYSQLATVEAVRDTMLADPTLHILVEGYCDADGSTDANTNISTFRAQAVKDCLVSLGIAPERITVVGKGTDTQATNPEQARRADIIQTAPTSLKEQGQKTKDTPTASPAINPSRKEDTL